MASNLPPGVTDRMIEEQAGGEGVFWADSGDWYWVPPGGDIGTVPNAAGWYYEYKDDIKGPFDSEEAATAAWFKRGRKRRLRPEA